ncbi:hypothetical protein SynBIOSU31_02821 [Synechococcus sp. BIOS-U3-1]|nr:hypothetical protein SynBIOSU31_02821 [Synechococcus sp. BIOS-U3-1]
MSFTENDLKHRLLIFADNHAKSLSKIRVLSAPYKAITIERRTNQQQLLGKKQRPIF